MFDTILTELSIIKIWIRNYKARPIIRRQARASTEVLDSLKAYENYIYYCGIPTHNNMGDQAQCYCIEKWLEENYPDFTIVKLPTLAFYDKSFKRKFEKIVKKEDFFVIQSGYCTTSSHYDHKMHRYIVKKFTKNPILIMPQTVLFRRKSDQRKTAQIYGAHPKLLFLARDRKSYEDSITYFKNTRVMKYPDIVTSLIGNAEYKFDEERNGILICVRNDSEKMYTDEQIYSLEDKFHGSGIFCELSDTNTDKYSDVLNIESELEQTIRFFQKHQVVITDRYHGTIFAIISNTPVIVISTLDHKVKTGTEWFKGIYDGSYYNADSLDEAYKLALKILHENRMIDNKAFFKREYYDKLKDIFEQIRG